MSSANPPAKRRRHDTASSTLSKPFKSPLRQHPPQSTEQPYPPSSTTTNPNTKDEPKPNPQETSNQPNTPPPRHPQNPAAAPTPPPSTTPKPRPNPNPKSNSRAKAKPTTDPTHHAAQTHHRTLQTRLAALRSDLDTAAQAQRIETSAKASELQALIAKWRAVAQDAAEEVFVGASERVGRMGGMEGYKERIRESKAAATRWDEEEEEERSVEDEGEREEVKKEEEEKETEKEGEEEEFTMEFMLKTLNIDPKTIGYDCAGQRWVK